MTTAVLYSLVLSVGISSHYSKQRYNEHPSGYNSVSATSGWEAVGGNSELKECEDF